MLKSEPKFDKNSEKQLRVLEKWRSFGPISLLEMHNANTIDFDQKLHFEEIQYNLAIYQGQLNH